MQPRKYLTKLSLLLVLTPLISGCSSLSFFSKPEEKIVVQSQIVEKRIPLQASPKPMSLDEPTFYVVTAENFDEFIEKYKKENGDPWVFYAFSVRSYETLALNLGEMRRYVEQQKSIIVYYENSITGKPTEEEPEKK